MAITAETRNEIITSVVGLFNGSPGASVLSDLVDQVDNGMSVRDLTISLSNSPVFQSIYPNFLTNEEFATRWVDTVVGDEIPASEEQWAVETLVSMLNAGQSRGEVMFEALNTLGAVPETDPLWGNAAARFNNRVEVATYHTVEKQLDGTTLEGLQSVLEGVGSSDASVVEARNNIDGVGGEGDNFILTSGADAVEGTPGNDTIVATESTLSSADILDGKAGTDMLRYASSGNAAINESGFESSNVEIIQVTSDAVGGTNFDTTGVTGATTLRNFNSSEDLTLTGMGDLVDVELVNVGSAGATATDPTPDTTLIFNAATLAGGLTAVDVLLNGNRNVDFTGIGTLTANGVEIFNVNTAGASTSMAGLASSTLTTVNVTGDQGLTISGNLVGATTVDASAFTGDLSVVADSGAQDVVVTGGSGNDTANFSNGWDANDSFDGGEGTDTLGLTYGVATTIAAANSGSASNVEILDITTVAGANGTVDMDNFSGVEKVILNAGINTGVTATIDDAVTGLEVELDVDSATTGNLVVDLSTDGSSDELTLTLDNVGAGDAIASLDAADAETLNISADDDTATGTGTLTVTSLTASDATTLNLSGDADLTITNTVDPTTAVLATIDASAATGNVSISGTNTASGGATIILGSGGDTFTFATNSGADTITLGAGADTLVYTAVAQSDSDMDTVTDFVSGTDTLSLGGITASPLLNFAGNRASFGQAQGALPGNGTPAAGLTAVYQVDDQILWLDIDDNGTLDNNDFRIKLDGVSAITNVDIGIASSGNSVTLTAPGQTVNTTSTTPGSTTNFNDTVTTSLTNLNTSTITGGLGTDTLVLSTAGTVNVNDGATGGTVTQMEVLTLAAGANTVSFTAGSGIASVNGGSGVDTINPANLTAGGTIATAAGNDVVNYGAALASTFSLGDGDDTFTSTVGAALGATAIAGGSGTDTLSLATGDNISAVAVSGFENLTLAGGAVTMSVAQHEAFTGTITAGGAETIVLSDAGTITGLSNVESYTLANGTNTVTLNASQTGTITGGTGADSINATSAIVVAATGITAGTGTDVLNITGGLTAATDLTANVTGVESITVSGASTANTLTVVNANGATSVDASGVTGGGISLDISGLTTANGNTTITLTDGNDTLATGISGAGNSNLVINFGSGNDIVADVAAVGTGTITMNFGVSAAGNIDSNTIQATTADFATGDVISFDGVSVGAFANSLAASGTAGIANTVVVTNDGTDSLIQLDANGNGIMDAGQDVQISIAGQVLTTGSFNLSGGDLIFA